MFQDLSISVCIVLTGRQYLYFHQIARISKFETICFLKIINNSLEHFILDRKGSVSR